MQKTNTNKVNGVKIIAEIGINHGGDMYLAKKMISSAKNMGADVVKFQLYDVDRVFPDGRVIVQEKNWYGVVKRTELSRENVFILKEYADKVGIEIMFSVFDERRLGWALDCGVKTVKIATRSSQDGNFIRMVIDRCNSKKVKVMISTDGRPGVWSSDADYLYCIPSYPAKPSQFKCFEGDMKQFPHPWAGISDHSIDGVASMIAVANGARIVERHFTFPDAPVNPDTICSFVPRVFEKWVRMIREMEKYQIGRT